MIPFFKGEFDNYRKMLCRESQKSRAGLNALNKFVQKICDAVSNTADHHEIQRNIRLLSICCQILESFNANIEVLMSSLDEDIFNEVMQNEPDSVCLRIKDWMGDLSSYQIGDTFKGYVSYLLQGDKKLCFIKDLSKPISVNFKDYLDSAFHGVPPYGYVFAVELNQKYFRAIRVDSEATNMSFRVRLIDIGETVPLSPNMTKFHLCDQAKRLPPLAIFCYIEKVNGKILNSLETVYKKVFDVHVNNICVNLLEVDLSSDGGIANEIQNQSLEKSIIECAENANQAPLERNQGSLEDDQVLLQDDPVPVQNHSVPSTTEKHVRPASTNPFLVSLDDLTAIHDEETPAMPNLPPPVINHIVPPPPLPQSPLPSLPSSAASPQKSTKSMSPLPVLPNLAVSSQKSSPSPLPSLPPLPPVPPRQRSFRSTDSNETIRIPIHLVRSNKPENASKTATEAGAVQSKPAPEIHETSKQNGAHPKQGTVCQENGYGHRPSAARNLSCVPSPSKGQELPIIPTHICDLRHLYVQFCEHSTKFDDVQYNMLQKITPKPLRHTPKPNDYVLARYADGNIYRARVEAINEKTATVFYVDYGNTEFVTLDVLFEWDTMCNVIPFQAVLCKLANAHTTLAGSESQAVQDFIYNNYLNKPCKILVLDHLDNGLLVKMKTEQDRDIVDEINEKLFPGCMV